MIPGSTSKLSKLQRFILIEAAKSLPELEETATRMNAWREGGVALGVFKSGLKPIEPGNISHITRLFILTEFFQLSLRKHRFRKWITDSDTDRIDAETAGRKRYNRANASLYRAVRRLEARGLLKRMSKRRAGLQLTEQGIAVANSLAAKAEKG
jgi:hypothetical protein